MTAKEKAKELFDEFYYLFPKKHRIDFGYKESKQCALITVDEIIKQLKSLDFILNETMSKLLFLDEVKQEIEQL